MHRRPVAVALACAATALLLAACGGGDDAAPVTTAPATTAAPTSAPSTTTSPPTTAAPTSSSVSTTAPTTTAAPDTTTATSTTAAAAGGSPSGDPVVLGTGSLTAVAPDGSHAIVRDVVDGLSETGCEGELEPVMLRVPIEGGDATPVFAGGEQYDGNLEELGDGRAVLLSGCEEFLSEIVVFAWSADGVLSEPTVVPRFSGDTIENLLDVAWSDGDLVYGVGTTFSFDGLDTRIVAIDLTTGAVTDVLPAEDAIVVGRLAAESVAIGDGETVTVRPLGGGPATLTVPGEWLAVSPDGAALAVVGPGVVVHRADTEPEALPVEAPGDAPVIDVSWSPDGGRIAYIARGVTDTVGVIELGTAATAIDSARRVFGLTWSADGAVLGYTRIREEIAGELGDTEAIVVRLDSPQPAPPPTSTED